VHFWGMKDSKIVIVGEVMERVEAMIPPYISRTAWINLLLEQALAEAEQKWEAKGRA
jgi:hypothetical protein